MNRTFTNFHNRRFEWAFQAKKEFINRFVRLDVDKTEVSSIKELTISVYGPTQVGKTTVILSLLGIKQDRLGQLSKWLRGKRKLGESSTVTVMRYERSSDHRFHVRLPNDVVKAGLTGEQLDAALQSIRTNVETEESYSVKPVVVEIPIDYFEERPVHLNIVDLPGVESAELKEVEHVKQCIKHWLPLSEVCLLVDDAAQLTAFTQYTINEMKNWFEQLSHFRVIPTRALSLDNIRKKIDKGLITSAEDLVADYANVLNRVLKMELDLTKTIYPIDVGNTWDVIREQEPVLYENMKDIMAEILRNLQTDLESLDVNELSFNRLTKLYKEAEEASKLELEQYEEKMKKQDELIKRQQFLLEHELEEAEMQYNQICSEIDVYEGFLKKVEFKNLDPDHIWDLVNGIIEYTPNNRKASVINDDALRLQEIVASELEIKFRRIKQEAGILKLGISNLLELPYLPPIPRVEQKIDAFWLKNTYEKAITRIRGIAYDWVTEMYQNYNLLLTPILKAANEQKEQFFHEAEGLKFVNTETRGRLEEELASYQKEKADLDFHYQKVYQLWNQDREHASQLQGYFIKYWMEYKEELQQHFHYGNAEERWLAAQYLQLLGQDGEKIIESLNE
ncbi:hypothetical protein [Bacillus salipaludis]|uniref:Dynamin family protein n=1 Tax=Bacillus salipaludis TaxID=2547811 RepID=A0ABW8RKH0_9BACI